MKGKEKQRKFHEALLQMLYPPPPSPPHQEDEKENEERKLTGPLYHLPEGLDNEEGNSSASGSSESNEDGNGGGPGKLTRAQRKRLRKKKLKEAASRRRKIIGPMLPSSGDDGHDAKVDVVSNIVPEAMQGNAVLEANVSGEAASCSKKKKLKQRRQSKKLAGEKLNPLQAENSSISHQSQCPNSGNNQ